MRQLVRIAKLTAGYTRASDTARLDAAAEDACMEEREFFSGDNIYVSLTRFVAFGKTYAMSGVTSVGAAEVKPDFGGANLLMILGAIFALIGLSAPYAFLFGILLLGAGYFVRASKTPDYYVMLTTAAGQVHAVRSKDRDYISSIVQALNDCIVARG